MPATESIHSRPGQIESVAEAIGGATLSIVGDESSIQSGTALIRSAFPAIERDVASIDSEADPIVNELVAIAGDRLRL